MFHLVSSVSLGLHGFLLTTSTTPKKPTSSGGTTTFIFLAFILLVGYFLLIRPQRQRARRQQQTQQEIGVGDDVMLSSGIVGRVVGFEGDRARVEIADGVEIEVVRRALAQRLAPAEVVEEEDDAEEVGPDPGMTEEDDSYDHASDEAQPEGYGGIPHGLPHEDATQVMPTTTAASAGNEPTEDVPRVPGGGLGGPTQPDGRAGKE